MDESMTGTGRTMTDETFILLRDFIYEQSGIYFADNKKSQLEARLGLRLRANNLADYEKYYYLLKYDPNSSRELRALFDSVTTNETSFFRSPPQIQAFHEKVVPEIISRKEKQGERQIRLWSAGCSTGEEPYTMGIVLKQILKDSVANWDVKIIASDISEKALRSAKNAVYSDYALRSVPPEIKQAFFVPDGNSYRIVDDVRTLVDLQYLNLNDARRVQIMKGFDIIFCRNVLIYFDDEAKKRFVAQLYDCLNHGGYLFIGHSESLHNISRAFKLVHFPGALGYKKE
ncbi:MAG TPA: protein-glutamate O-methyltransferase CheR [Deltaproteobacteria bacterium]|mgnify:CR=1 FL=1|nr:protein-glutamate O-methyltransferase CheR [Deltaproteobacteria bacterium]HQI82866.1 protein-glutamate O-methyltransferase CheR [Deltaproteobacteria bacterium]